MRDGRTVETLEPTRRSAKTASSRRWSAASWTTAIRRASRRSARPARGEELEVYHPMHADRQVIKNVNLNVRTGEVVGIAGLMGAGRTEFAMSCSAVLWPQDHRRGAGPRQAGRCLDRRARRSSRLAYVTEDRKTYGLNLIDTSSTICTLANLGGVSRHGVIDDIGNWRSPTTIAPGPGSAPASTR